MTKWFKTVAPLAIAAVLVTALGLATAGGPVLAGKSAGNNTAPSLTVAMDQALASPTTTGQAVSVTGSGFPRTTAVFVVITNMPSILVQSDGSGSFQTGTFLSEPGTYRFSACFYKKGGWDCNSTPPVSVTVQY